MAKSSSYSMKNVAGTVDGQLALGFWDGDDAVTVSDVDDVGGMLVGADGSSIFSQYAGKAATVTLRLQHTSATHRLLLQRLERQQTPGIRVVGFPVTLIDVDSGEGGSTDDMYIQEAPDDQKGKNASVREWVLITGDWKRNITNTSA
jgi:hypothetical protein